MKNEAPIKNAITFQTNVYASDKMDFGVAEGILKAVMDKQSDWKNVHPLAKQWWFFSASVTLFHTGVINYYTKNGIWTPEAATQTEKYTTELQIEN